MVKATLTRPVSIGAVSTCDRKLSLVENVDIGPTSIPEPRIISLEPILRRPRRNIRPSSKREVQTEDKSEPAVGIERLESTRSADVQSLAHTNESNGTGRRRSLVSADLQSEISEDSGASSSSTGYIVGQTVESAIIPNEAASTATQAGPRKTITAKIELLKAGCLPGDSIPITISIQHTKQIKSLHGIIITFYRLGRIDSAPPLSLFSDLTGKELERLKHEEYYPKSKTGLGGLSLTSPASSGVFRKDLSQTLAPIVIDPATLSTVVSTSIRVPEDVFPTVTGVPGEMISFRYYVEVVVDLGGKLAGQDRHLPRLGMVSLPSMTNPSNVQVRRDISVAPTLAAWGGNIVNTDQIRREKSVVASMFEVLVGSTDSARQRGRGATVSRQATTDTVPEDDGFKSTGQPGAMIAEEMGSAIDDVDENGNSHDFGERDAVRFGNLYEPSSSSHGVRIGNDGSWQAPNSIPMPEPQSTEGLSEKELLRLAETRLLPSQPPKEAGSSAQFQQHATAPPDPDADVPAYEANHANQPLDVAVPGPSNLNRGNDSLSGPSPPPPEAFARPSPSSTPTEDKQELERRRLQAEASSPNDFPHDDDGVESSSAALHISSAPLVPEHDTYGDHLPERDSHGDTLPEYRK